MLFRNIATGQEMNVTNLKLVNGRIFFSVRNKGCGQKFFDRNICLVLDENIENGTFLKIAAGWELVKAPKESKPRTKAESKPAPAPAPKAESPKAESESKPAEKPAEKPVESQKAAESTPAPAPAPKAAETAENADLCAQLARIISSMKGGVIDYNKVREIAKEEVKAELKAQKPDKVVEIRIIKDNETETTKVTNPHPLLTEVWALVANDRATGRYPWLFGPAGSGKSTLAKQVAEKMHLPFYSVSSLMQKYELEGYCNAAGEYIETTFYKASKEGGIFLFDEASTTAGEVQVAFNSMLANLWYNFPKIGMVKAHKDFHVIAADNTAGRGANSTYSARFQQDASTLDRYTCVKVDYTDEQDLAMAENDTELVAFIKELRKAINENSRLTYTASPRALKAIKAHQKMGVFTELKAFELGICSGWNAQDIRTLNARLNGNNKYFRMFNEIANNAK